MRRSAEGVRRPGDGMAATPPRRYQRMCCRIRWSFYAHSIRNRKAVMRLLPGLIFIAIPSACAQFMVDTVAGGKIFSGVPAQSAPRTVPCGTQDAEGNIYVCVGDWV